MDPLSWFLINHMSLSTLFGSACQSTACTLEEVESERFIFCLSETRAENIMIIVNLSLFEKSRLL